MDVQYQGGIAVTSWSMAALMSSKLEPAIWSHDTGHIGIHGGVDVHCTVTKTKFSRNDGSPYFLTHSAAHTRQRSAIIQMHYQNL